uniref:Uncharacterized protein n=1 Tax=Anguilla anguilla TaxID=7936 RepID=A0A0E9RMK8_ANGAN
METHGPRLTCNPSLINMPPFLIDTVNSILIVTVHS